MVLRANAIERNLLVEACGCSGGRRAAGGENVPAAARFVAVLEIRPVDELDPWGRPVEGVFLKSV